MLRENTEHGLTICLFDFHQEYLWPVPQNSRVRCRTVVDFSLLAELCKKRDRAIAAALMVAIPRAVFDNGGGDCEFGAVSELYGTHDDLAEYLWQCADLLFADGDTPSGDDDTYDYWPKSLDVLQTFARDLDSATGTTRLLDKLRRRYLAHLVVRGCSVSEYHFDADTVLSGEDDE